MADTKKELLPVPTFDVKYNEHSIWLVFADQKSADNKLLQLRENRIQYMNEPNVPTGLFNIGSRWVIKLNHANYAHFCALPPQGTWKRQGELLWASFKDAETADNFRKKALNLGIGAEWGPRQDVNKQSARVYNMGSGEYRVYYTAENKEKYSQLTDTAEKLLFREMYFEEQYRLALFKDCPIENVTSATANFCKDIEKDKITPKSFHMKLIEIINFALGRFTWKKRTAEASALIEVICALKPKIQDVTQDWHLPVEAFKMKYLAEYLQRRQEMVEQPLVVQQPMPAMHPGALMWMHTNPAPAPLPVQSPHMVFNMFAPQPMPPLHPVVYQGPGQHPQPFNPNPFNQG